MGVKDIAAANTGPATDGVACRHSPGDGPIERKEGQRAAICQQAKQP